MARTLPFAAPARPITPAAGEVPFAPGGWSLDPGAALAVPTAFALLLGALGLLPSVSGHFVLRWSFWGASMALLAWATLLAASALRRGRRFRLDVVLRKQHYIQACAHLSIFAYWGWYWRVVYDSAHLIAAQIVFAYALDMLLVWSRRESYTLGFGPFPIVFSTNLFLWFKPDWFYLQFVMIAVGFCAKELIRWDKDGRRVHIFNPSSFPLFIASILLVTTGSTAITWGREIANTFELPPYMRLWIFVAGLPGQFLFGVVTMTLSSVATATLFGVVYHLVFGTYYFVDAFIPAAVFLGMHLLFTDPSTAPRTELGRILFGVLYGLAVIVLFGVLGHFGAPTFYDKLLAVPVMNLAIQAIDRSVGSGLLKRLDPSRLGSTLPPRRRHLAYMSIWAVVFIAMSDPTMAYRPRRWVPFWEQACQEDRRNGCLILSRIETQYCNEGSPWACNELGVLVATGRASATIAPRVAFERACAGGTQAGCANLAAFDASPGRGDRAAYRRAEPQPRDYPIVLQQGQGRLGRLEPGSLYEEACRQGWADGCVRLAEVYFFAPGAARDVPRALAALERACDFKLMPACANLGQVHRKGDGVPADPHKGAAYLERACDGGFRPACDDLAGASSPEPRH